MITEAPPGRSSVLRQPTFWAGVAPLLCAAHCVATPLLVLALPWLAVGKFGEMVIFAASALLVTGVLVPSVRAHGRSAVWLPVVLGLAIWGGGLLHLVPGVAHEATTVIGTLVLAGGLVWSSRLRHLAVCADCHCAAH